QKDAILAKLTEEGKGGGQRAAWARTTLAILQKKVPSAGGGKALEIVGRGDENKKNPGTDRVYLREPVAFALNFWDGDRVEPTLVWLAQDNGHGVRIEVDEAD